MLCHYCDEMRIVFSQSQLLTIIDYVYVTIALSASLDADLCGKGESFWCQSLEAAEVCSAVDHCTETIWKNQKLETVGYCCFNGGGGGGGGGGGDDDDDDGDDDGGDDGDDDSDFDIYDDDDVDGDDDDDGDDDYDDDY